MEYTLAAYLLYMNMAIGEAEVMAAETLPRVKMPSRDNFFPEFRKLMPQSALPLGLVCRESGALPKPYARG
jgi:hypothetical protein